LSSSVCERNAAGGASGRAWAAEPAARRARSRGKVIRGLRAAERISIGGACRCNPAGGAGVLPGAMKAFLPILAATAIVVPPTAAGQAEKKNDLFESGLRQVMDDYRKGDDEAVVEKLRILLKMMEEKGAKKIGELL